MKHGWESVLEQYEAEYEDGVLISGYLAALTCLQNGVAIPPWIVPMVDEAIQIHFTDSRRGRGRRAPKDDSRVNSLKRFIVSEVERITAPGPREKTKQDAFAVIANELTKYYADGKTWTPGMVSTVYYRERKP